MHARLTVLLGAVLTLGCPEPMRTITPDDVAKGGDCPATTGAGTAHTMNVTADETWTAAGSPHVVSSLRLEATVTLEACAVVLLKKEAVLTIGNSNATDKAGKLIAQGTFDGTTLKPVVFRAETAGERWSNVFVQQTGSLDLSYTAVLNGGNRNAASTNAAIEARGNQAKPLQKKVRAKYVVVRDSGSQGITLSGYASFTDDSEELFISGSGAEPEIDSRFLTGFPLDLEPGGVGTIPKKSTLTGNRRDAVFIRSVTRLAVDEQFRNVGVPYIVHGDFLMYDLDKTPLTLTIEAGVTMKFEKQGSGNLGLTLGNKASQATVKLLAQGTAAAPILLTSAETSPAIGDWRGVYMANGPADGNAMEFVTVEYAGGFTGTTGFGCGPGTNVGGLLLIDWRPNDAFVKSCTFRHLNGAGIVSGWSSDLDGPALAGNNTFEDIVAIPMQGSCNVTKWAPATGPGCASRPLCVQ